MTKGLVEPSRYPRNPLDVLAQQIVAMAAMDPWSVDDLYAAVRGAAPFAELSRRVFEGVLDMLSGRYPSDEFAELRPRVTWDRVNGTIVARAGRQAGGDRQRRHDSRPRALRRLPRRRLARRGPRRRARRGDGLRGAGRRDLPARRLDLAHRADHPRPRARFAGAGPARQDAVLERRGPGPADRARSGHRQAHPRAAPRRPGRGDGAPHQRSRAERGGRRQPAPVPRRPAGGDRRRPGRPHHPDRALPGRPRRLAGVGAHAVRQPGPRPLGDGRHRAAARRARPRRRGDVERRRLRRPHARGRTRRSIRRCSCPTPTTSSGWSCASSVRPRSSPPASARPPAGRCCCRAAAPDNARRSGSSASAPPTCWPSPRASARSRSSSRPIANAYATSSTCRRWSTCWPGCAAAACACTPWTCRSRRHSRRRCSSATSPITSTTATRRWPSAARTRCRWTRRSWPS